ncbi:MAG: hypothetical protein NPIRA04_00530 [Nitrospirales bacterium]|nr:MAG: hypothetical protein NPIRA04_00530 [Nitrospirales bacterium]
MVMKKIIILTGTELRHTAFRQALAVIDGITVMKTYCEGLEKSLRTIVEARGPEHTHLELSHLNARAQSEEDFFGFFCTYSQDFSNPTFISKGAINESRYVNEMTLLNPDLLIAYGCSIIKEPLLSFFKGRFLNVHLGLSPYYRGSGTNFWPLVNGEPEYVGATFMYIDVGVDTGEVIHQIRARIFPNDTLHQIGNRLIGDMAKVYGEIIQKQSDLEAVPQIPEPLHSKFYRKKDFSAEAVTQLEHQFADGMISRFLSQRDSRYASAPIVEHPKIQKIQA